MSTAVYLENHTPIASRGFISPYELWYGRPPSYDHLRVFGCLAYVHVGQDRQSGKFSDTAKWGEFVGYQEGHHNYRVWLPDERRVIYSHDVVFNESCFPMKGSYSTFLEADEGDYLSDHPLAETELTTPDPASELIQMNDD